MPRVYTIIDLDKKLLDAVMDIDRLVYPAKYQGRAYDIYARFVRNRDMFLLMYEEDKLIGYLCLFPLRQDFYARIRASDVIYDTDEIPADQIVPYEKNGDFFLFAISLAVHPDYQGRGYSAELGRAFERFIAEKNGYGINIKSVLAAAITPQGEHFLRAHNFTCLKQLQHGEKLYERVFT